VGSKKAPATRSTRARRDHRRAERGGEVSFTGFGKFHVAERGPRRASTRAPASGSRSRAARCPRFSAGSALKTKVKG
jgi:DNA-binding protein HU-beta